MGDLPVCKRDEDAILDSIVMLLLVALMIIGYLIGIVLRQFHSKYLHETAVLVLLGLLTGCLAFIVDSARLQWVASFDPDLFFIVLLPPILFESGYNMNKYVFFSNIVSTITFAVIGTTIGALFVALGMLAVTSTGLFTFTLTYAECLVRKRFFYINIS